MRHRTVGQVAVAVVGRGARDHRRTILRNQKVKGFNVPLANVKCAQNPELLTCWRSAAPTACGAVAMIAVLLRADSTMLFLVRASGWSIPAKLTRW